MFLLRIILNFLAFLLSRRPKPAPEEPELPLRPARTPAASAAPGTEVATPVPAAPGTEIDTIVPAAPGTEAGGAAEVPVPDAVEPAQPRPLLPKSSPPPSKTIVPFLVYPKIGDNLSPNDPGFDDIVKFNEIIEIYDAFDEETDRYYVSRPWKVDEDEIGKALIFARDWLGDVLGHTIEWNELRPIDSRWSLEQWRMHGIGLLRGDVEELGFDWKNEFIYLGFVRGMGGYAGGLEYRDDSAGSGIVGDICLEAICRRTIPTAGSVLLGDINGWHANTYSQIGQTGAFIHEALHGLFLPHPEGWPEENRPESNETLMGNWSTMPNFAGTRGLTHREINKVLQWV